MAIVRVLVVRGTCNIISYYNQQLRSWLLTPKLLLEVVHPQHTIDVPAIVTKQYTAERRKDAKKVPSERDRRLDTVASSGAALDGSSQARHVWENNQVFAVMQGVYRVVVECRRAWGSVVGRRNSSERGSSLYRHPLSAFAHGDAPQRADGRKRQASSLELSSCARESERATSSGLVSESKR